MIKNYLKVAIRNLWKNKAFSAINIFGLSFGICCCLLMLLFIKDELSFDSFNKNAKSIYRIAFSDYLNQGGFATTPMPIGPALKEQFPEIKAATRIAYQEPSLFKYNTNQYFETYAFADADIFKIFSFPFAEGNPNTALTEPNSIVISERMAKKYFGNEDPLNKIINIGSSGKLNSVVKGVFKGLSDNSHLQFDFLISCSTRERLGWSSLWRQMPGNYTYVLLPEDYDISKLTQKLRAFVEKNVGNELKENGNPTYKMMLQPLTEIHLTSHLQEERPGSGNMAYIYLFASIALAILIIACINFINFATAHAIKRTKEIGVRKVIGAQRFQIIKQFLSESVITFFFATLLSLLFAQLLLPVYNELSGKSFHFPDLLQVRVIIGLIATGVIAAIAAGFFPAISIAGISSIEALKGKTAYNNSKDRVRKSLVVVQFVASLSLIIASVVVFQQMRFIRRQTFINQAEQVIVFPVNSTIAEKFEVLKNQLNSNPDIVYTSAATNVPGFTNDGWPIRLNESTPLIQSENYVTDDDFLAAMNFKLLAGRKLSGKNASDITSGFLLNETAIHELGFKDPQQAVGKTIIWGADNKKRGTIQGVLKDFHFKSLHEKIAPALFQFAPYDWMTYNYVLVKLKPTDVGSTIDFVKKTVAGIDAGWVVDYKFYDDNFAQLHIKDEQQGKVFTVFAGIAILISCLGLLGLSIYSTEQRRKEIGIRKVLGASVNGIVVLLSKDFVKLVLIALIIASPLAWYFMTKWLDDFAYRINISWWVFVMAGMIALLIALVTVSFQAIKAAIANPVKSLRTE